MYYVKLPFFPLDQLTKVSFCRRSRKFCRITSMHSSVVDAIQLYEMQTNKKQVSFARIMFLIIIKTAVCIYSITTSCDNGIRI